MATSDRAASGVVTTPAFANPAGTEGMAQETPPLRLYRQAKRAGMWDPRSVHLQADVRDWERLTGLEQDLLLRLTALFHAGEEEMSLDIAPLLVTVAREGRVEEERFLATLRADEARHAKFFERVLDEVCRATGDLRRYHTASFRAFFGEELPRALHGLVDDPSPAAQAEALVAYTMIGEGVLSETGHDLFTTALQRRGLMPGLRHGLRLVQRDEARHMTYGVYFLARLVAEDPGVWQVIERRMNALLVTALGIVSEFFAAYSVVPFELSLEDAVNQAITRFARRSARIERAKEHGAAIAATVGDPVDDLLGWLAEQVGSLTVRAGKPDTSGVRVLEVVHVAGPASLLITQQLLDHYLIDEIIAVLHEQRIPRRLADEPGLRLMCVEGSGRIVVQQPAQGGSRDGVM